MAISFTPAEKKRLRKMRDIQLKYLKYSKRPKYKYMSDNPWSVNNVPGDKELWERFQEYKTYGSSGKPKPPETWLTRRKALMGRRYTGTPAGGFSGVLGGAPVQKKKLLGA